MPIGSASIRRASGAMNKSEKKAVKAAFRSQATLAEIEVEKISGDLPEASEALIKSIKKFGLMVPVVLFSDGGKLWIVSGRSRLAAAKACGLATVKAVIVETDGSGCAAAKKDLFAVYSDAAHEEIAVTAVSKDASVQSSAACNDIHEEKFNAIRSIGSKLPDYLL